MSISIVCRLVFQAVLALIQIRIIEKWIEFYVNKYKVHELSVKLKLNLYYQYIINIIPIYFISKVRR